VVFTVIFFQLSLEYTNDKLFVEIGGWLFVAEGHKLNITDGITDKIILSVSIGHYVGKNIPSPCDLSFLNPSVILFVIPLVYTNEIFPSAYLQVYFIIRLIPLVMLSIKVTHHFTVWFFLFFIFPL